MATTAYTLNTVPVNFPNASVDIGLLDYTDHELLRELRTQYGQTHVFRRHESHEIIAVPIAENAPKIGERFVTWKLWEHPFLCADLVRNALLRLFCEWSKPSITYNPLRALDTNKNLLQACLPGDLTCPDWLSVSPQYEIDVRVMHFDNHNARIYLTLNLHHRNQINLNCRDLL